MRLTIFLIFLIVGHLIGAQEITPSAHPEDEGRETSQSPFGEAGVVMDDAHKRVSSTILLLSNRIDSFFGSRRGDDEANGSRLRLFYDSTFRQNQRWDDRIDMRFSLRLPQLQKLLKVSFKKEGGSDKRPPTNAPENENKKNKEVAPSKPDLKDLLLTANKWTFNVNTGLRVDIPPNPFARARLRRTMIFFGVLEFNPTQEATWFLEQGFGLNFTHDLDYSISPNLLFRIANSVFWTDETDQVTTTHGPQLFQQLSQNRALAYSIQAQGINRPTLYINNYSASIQYRQLIHSNWLFMEVRPAIDFPETENWNEVYSLFFRLEAVFGTI